MNAIVMLSIFTLCFNAMHATYVIPLHEAVRASDCDEVSAILSRHCDIDAIDGNGYSALHYAVETRNKTIIRSLIAAGINEHIKNYNLETALNIADRKGYLDITDILENVSSVRRSYQLTWIPYIESDSESTHTDEDESLISVVDALEIVGT